jgi:hypothetical protein
MHPASEDYSFIATRLREIRKEAGSVDDNWRTATGTDLDGIASFYGLGRYWSECESETDAQLRDRIFAEIRKKTGAF